MFTMWLLKLSKSKTNSTKERKNIEKIHVLFLLSFILYILQLIFLNKAKPKAKRNNPPKLLQLYILRKQKFFNLES